MKVQDIIKQFLSALDDPGMTGYGLAKDSGIPKTLVYELANGKRQNVSLRNLQKMQDYITRDKQAA